MKKSLDGKLNNRHEIGTDVTLVCRIDVIPDCLLYQKSRVKLKIVIQLHACTHTYTCAREIADSANKHRESIGKSITRSIAIAMLGWDL